MSLSGAELVERLKTGAESGIMLATRPFMLKLLWSALLRANSPAELSSSTIKIMSPV